jgi:hypothetical protein
VTSDVGGAFGGRQPGRWRRLWRAAASEGGGQERLAIPRVSAAGKKSGSNYHVSGEGLPWNWMLLLTGEGLHL